MSCRFIRKCPFKNPLNVINAEVPYCPKRTYEKDDPFAFLFLNELRVKKLSRVHLN